MGLWDKIVGEFIDVIEWVEDDPDTLVYRFPTHNREIQMGSTLIVRETQRAAFVYQGQLTDMFDPGDYKLHTDNIPVMTTLRNWSTGFNAPFKAEVYYFNTRQFTDLKWGTPQPITIRDPELGPVRVRAFGIYAMRVADAEKVMRELLGTQERLPVSSTEDQLRKMVTTRLADFVAESKIPFLDFAANLVEFSEAVGQAMQQDFARFGLELTAFNIENLSLPPEVEKVLDQRTSMGLVGDLSKYTQFQVASSIPDAAKNEGGLAAAGAGVGIGMGMGEAMASAMRGGQQQAPAQQPAAPQQVIKVRCGQCGHLNDETTKFCPECGNKLIP